MPHPELEFAEVSQLVVVVVLGQLMRMKVNVSHGAMGAPCLKASLGHDTIGSSMQGCEIVGIQVDAWQ